MRRFGLPSEPAQIVRSVRLHAGIQQQILAATRGMKKAWLAKRELGIVRMTVTEAMDLILAILTINAAETVEKNRAKTTILQDSDTTSQSQVAEKSTG